MLRERVNCLFLAVIVCVLINNVSCLKCYNCVAKSEKDECMDPKGHNLEPQECVPDKIRTLANQVNQFASNFGAVIGIDNIDKQTKHIADSFSCQKIESKVNNEKIVIRGCQIRDPSIDYCAGVEKQISGEIAHCSLCNEDGCNGGHWLAPISTLALLVPALALLIPTLMF